MLLHLLACADTAEDRAERFLDEHARGTAIVRSGERGFSGAVGGPLPEMTVTLDAQLAPCGPLPAFDAEILIEPGRFPWPVSGAPACAAEALARLPLDPPVTRGTQELVHVRWRPDEVLDRVVSTTDGPSTVGRALAPPYLRVADATPVWSVDLVDGQIRFHTSPVGFHNEGPLEAPGEWARHLTCPAPALDLVRVAIEIRDGEVDEVYTVPSSPCVEGKVDDWVLTRRAFPGGATLGEVDHALVVLDVPVGAW